MKKGLILALLLYIVFSVGAQTENKYTGSLLWKVSGKDITKPSYILGTHHLTDISFLDKVNGFKESFEACNVVIGELDLGSKNELMQLVQTSVMIPEGEKGYKELLSEKEFEKLNADLLTHLGAPLEPFIGMKPSLISTLLAIKIYSNINPNYNPKTHQAIDEYVQKLAKEQNKTVKGLESADDQLKILFSDPIKEQLDDLICMLSEVEVGFILIEKLEKLYETADLNGMNQLGSHIENLSACSTNKEKERAILDNRNANWMKQLPQLLKDDSNFIAVGALHLAGEEGLLYQLAQMGYTVEAVK